MKITSILTYAAAASLTAFLIGLIATQDASIGYAALATTMAALIAIHDYSPRSYFVVTSPIAHPKAGRMPASPFSPMIGSNRRKTTKRRLSTVA